MISLLLDPLPARDSRYLGPQHSISLMKTSWGLYEP